MKKLNILAFLLLPPMFAGFSAPAARAQLDTNFPIVVKQSKAKPVWMSGYVIHADGQNIVVSEPANPRQIHTFTYSGKSLAKMAKVLDAGGYQTGDKVRILYQPGDTVALDLRGKPSKSP